MAYLTVDTECCLRDGLCALECPLGLIRQDGEGRPVGVESIDKLCVQCGHCVGICPSGCLSVGEITPESLPEVPADPVRDLGLERSALQAWMTLRRSVRNFKDRPVPREVVERCLEAARFAPSGINMQPVHWAVVEDRARVRDMARLTAEALRDHPGLDAFLAAYDTGRDVMLRDAPHVIAAHADATGWYDPMTDVIIALSHFELAAHAEGVGTCWAGLFRRAVELSAPLREMLGLPEGHRVYGALMFGWPKMRMRRLPPRKPVRVTWR